jgi:hypothetical protein
MRQFKYDKPAHQLNEVATMKEPVFQDFVKGWNEITIHKNYDSAWAEYKQHLSSLLKEVPVSGQVDWEDGRIVDETEVFITKTYFDNEGKNFAGYFAVDKKEYDETMRKFNAIVDEIESTNKVNNMKEVIEGKTITTKIKFEIKNRWTGKVLFEYEKEKNTIKDTVTEAVKQGAYLQGADLQGAYLRGAYLQGADLRRADLQGADLRRADLQGAYLRGAYLQGADLRRADLQGADLRRADLQGADLREVNLQGVRIKTATVFTGLYDYIVIPYITEANEPRIKMGCYDRNLQEWEEDFWNNNIEFPNDNSPKSNQRLFAFETAKKWLELISNNSKTQ